MKDEKSLFDYWRILANSKKTIILTVSVVTVLAVIGSYFLTKTYRSQCTIMPIGGSKGMMGFALPSAAHQVGASTLLDDLLPSSSSAPQILAILNSRSMAERIIKKFGLINIFFPERAKSDSNQALLMEDALKQLSPRVSMVENRKTQLIEISVEMDSPKLAADIANGLLTNLADFIHKNTFTAAKRKRIFIEEQLEKSNANLLKLGKELSEFYSSKKISSVSPNVDVNAAPESWTRESSGIFNKNLKSMGNPLSLSNLEKKTAQLEKKVNDLDAKMKKTTVSGIPQQVYLEYLTFRRDLLGKVNALLTQQYELAKIDESKEELNFQVIDKASVPVRKYRPKRLQILIFSALFSLFVSVSWVFLREYSRTQTATQEQRAESV